ncbi:hypothetical protein DFH08DRAFT_960102 [Mycena albidolilacea]|uniref:Uncharacterized protein n=1 Tax=Mycena albidolilacea TaxID=1033008 RepID=A0AAD7A1I7_9AGAR|nr:hypothetical protein DFH08DRAFT_960102 [Mycena albidolilacea]
MAIPKAVTDKLVHQESRIMGLEARIDQDGCLIAALQTSEARLQHEIDDLDNENTQLLQKLQSVEAVLDQQTRDIDRLFSLLEQKSSAQVPPDADKTKNRTAVRKLFLLAMGLGKKGSTLKDAALLKPSTAGGGYICDTEASNGKLLHPDWNVTFADNSVWHSRTVKWMRQNMKTQFPAAMIDKKSDDAILDQLSTVFRNIVQAYNILQKESKAKKNANDPTVPEDDGDLPAENEMPDDAPARRAGRHKSRKTRKCDERIMVLQKAGIQLHHHYVFFLQPAYQSTDESDQSDVIDPDTDTEKADEVPAPSTRKPWKTRTPLYCADEASEAFNQEVATIERYVLNYRVEQERKNGPAQSAPHPRIPGDWKDTPLPRLGATKLRILRPCIHAEWLADNEDQDVPTRIQEEEVESQGVERADEDADDERD